MMAPRGLGTLSSSYPVAFCRVVLSSTLACWFAPTSGPLFGAPSWSAHFNLSLSARTVYTHLLGHFVPVFSSRTPRCGGDLHTAVCLVPRASTGDTYGQGSTQHVHGSLAVSVEMPACNWHPDWVTLNLAEEISAWVFAVGVAGGLTKSQASFPGCWLIRELGELSSMMFSRTWLVLLEGWN